MLSIDHLQEITLELERTKSVPGDNTVAQLNDYLRDIFDHPKYQEWLARDQFGGASHRAGRFIVPAEIGIRHADAKRILDRYQLTMHRQLMVKVDRHFDRIHLTDGFWVDPKVRVYPTADESEQLCSYIKSMGYDGGIDVFIDPACGSGHHGMAVKADTRVSMDIGVRALTYSVLNAVLSGSERQLYALNDLRQGFPGLINRFLKGNVLIAVNMPFAIFPRYDEAKPLVAQDGGSHGISLTLAALKAAEKLWNTAQGLQELRCVVLFYSLGKTADGPWEVVDRAREMFGSEAVTARILTDEKMWRVNGLKEQANPMPVENLELKAGCRFTFEEFEAESALQGYRRRQQEFKDEGWNYLGYGLLDIKLSR